MVKTETIKQEPKETPLQALKRIAFGYLHKESPKKPKLFVDNSPFAAAEKFAQPVALLTNEFNRSIRAGEEPQHLIKTATKIAVDSEFPKRSKILLSRLKTLILPLYPKHGNEAIEIGLKTIEQSPQESIDDSSGILGGINESKIVAMMIQTVKAMAHNKDTVKLIMNALKVDDPVNIGFNNINTLLNVDLCMQDVFFHILETVLDQRDAFVLEHSQNKQLKYNALIRQQIRQGEFGGSVMGVLGRHLSFMDEIPQIDAGSFFPKLDFADVPYHGALILNNEKPISKKSSENGGDDLFKKITDLIWNGQFDLSWYPDGLIITQDVTNKDTLKPETKVHVLLPFTESTIVCYSYVPSELEVGPNFKNFFIKDQKLSLLTSKEHVRKSLYTLAENDLPAKSPIEG